MIINNIITQKLISKIKNSPNYNIGDFLVLTSSEQKELDGYNKLLDNNYPLDYIIGYVDINDIRFYIEEGIFIPRPCTEELIKLCDNIKTDLVIDICAGTGLIGLSIAKLNPAKKIILIEQSQLAYENILKTIDYNNIKNVEVLNIDALNHDYTQYINYTIICNPPYVPEANIFDSVKYEPKDAIYSGKDGLTFFNKLLTMVSTNLPYQIYLELDPSNIDQAQCSLNQYYHSSIVQDNEGFPRFLIGVNQV
jgi:release factor glutamine methyltransferase